MKKSLIIVGMFVLVSLGYAVFLFLRSPCAEYEKEACALGKKSFCTEAQRNILKWDKDAGKCANALEGVRAIHAFEKNSGTDSPNPVFTPDTLEKKMDDNLKLMDLNEKDLDKLPGAKE